ncbi:diguanylate cyclase [Agromyces sp. GXS1127]|uniref:sensor domain-containing diguanylate cyclase n=1 Tax=Agromyces sp. GXS1127 TaxID=3424181 RepID=UPI003D31ED13
MTISEAPAPLGRGAGDLGTAYSDLFHRAPCGYVTTTPDGVITRVNGTLESWTGRPGADLLGAPFVDLLGAAGRLFYESRFAAALGESGEVHEVVLSLQCADGRDLPVLVNAIRVRAEDGACEEIRVAVFDATERHDYERQLLLARRQAEASEARVRLLQDASLAFGLAMSEQQLAEALVSTVRTGLFAVGAAVLLMKDGRQSGMVAEGVQIEPLLSTAIVSLITQAIESDEIITIESLEQVDAIAPDLGSAMREQHLCALSIGPLRGATGTKGVLLSFYDRDQVFDAETRDVQAALARHAAQVIRRVRLQDELAHRALHDQLTGLANRKLLEETLEAEAAGAERDGRPLSVVFIDLDGFKPINDELGHRVGDEVLVEVAERLRRAARASDQVARYGGDEFVVVCQNADAASAAVIAERFRAEVELPLQTLPRRYAVAASIGVATWDPGLGSEPLDTDRLLHLADEAMYVSKGEGRNRVTTVSA